MHEVKLSAMHLGGRKRVLYEAILKLVLQETCVSEFVLLWRNMWHSGKCPQIPEKCLSYSGRAPFRVGISAYTVFHPFSDLVPIKCLLIFSQEKMI